MEGLGNKQKNFIIEYLKDSNGTQAAIRAGYSPKTAAEQSSRLLSNVKIKAEIDRHNEKACEEALVTTKEIIDELKKVAFSDIRKVFDEDGSLKSLNELSDEAAGSIASVESDELFEGYGKEREHIGETRKVKLWDKLRALELLGKYKNIFSEKVDITGIDSILNNLRKKYK